MREKQMTRWMTMAVAMCILDGFTAEEGTIMFKVLAKLIPFVHARMDVDDSVLEVEALKFLREEMCKAQQPPHRC